MLKLRFFLLSGTFFALLLQLGCVKGTTPAPVATTYSVYLTVDGVKDTLSYLTTAIRTTDSSGSNVTAGILAQKGYGFDKNIFLGVSAGSSSIATGTYTANSTTGKLADINYITEKGAIYSPSSGKNFTITVTALNYTKGGTFAGTFSGTLYDLTAKPHTVTDGSFSVVFSN